MSSLATGFAVRMCKRAVSSRGETTPVSEVPDGKWPKRSGPDRKAQNSLDVIAMDSLERATDALPTLKGAAQEALREPCASLENGVLDGGLPMLIKR